MEKTIERLEDGVVDLGSVSEETRGAEVGFEDSLNGRQISPGLSDD